jgi:GTPase SAR1 family protein
VLVGETGVGKSGLAYRLSENRFVSTISTDAAWATQLSLPHDVNTKDTEREIWLWDFAGQSDYRLIHQLFMDETSLAVLVFNPQSDNPFEGLGQWDRDLQRAARRPFNKLLVAGRCDRGVSR